MHSDLGTLHIPAEEVENLVNLSSLDSLAVDAYRAFILKRPKQILSVLLTEFFAFGLLLIFVIPVILIILRNSGLLPENVAGITRLFLFILGVCLLGIAMGNVYLCKQVKQSKSLARLMDEVDKYNGIIQAIALIDELELANNSPTRSACLDNRKEVVEALKITKQSLIGALRVERIIRSHKNFLDARYELLANLEHNLNSLMAVETSDRVTEYGQLLNESLQIGLNVHREVRKLQNRK